MRIPVIAVFMSLMSVSWSAAATAGPRLPAPNASTTEFELVLARELPDWLHEYMVPGAAIALIEDGRVTGVKGYGFADVAAGRPMSPDTIFNAGSISKSVTAWGMMRLVEAGLASLGAPVDIYLRRWHI